MDGSGGDGGRGILLSCNVVLSCGVDKARRFAELFLAAMTGVAAAGTDRTVTLFPSFALPNRKFSSNYVNFSSVLEGKSSLEHMHKAVTDCRTENFGRGEELSLNYRWKLLHWCIVQLRVCAGVNCDVDYLGKNVNMVNLYSFTSALRYLPILARMLSQSSAHTGPQPRIILTRDVLIIPFLTGIRERIGREESQPVSLMTVLASNHAAHFLNLFCDFARENAAQL